MIVQNAAKNGLTDFSFTVSRNDLDKAMKVLEKEVTPYLGEEGILTDASIAKISCVGIGMRATPVLPPRCSASWLKKTSTSR